MALEDFFRQYNSWNVQQRIDWERFAAGLAGNPPPTQQRIDQIVYEYASQQYGAYAGYLNHAEVGPLLLKSAREGWTPERLQAELSRTTWWQSTTASQRQFDQLRNTDPAEAANQVATVERAIRTLLSQQGVEGQYTDARITQLATQFARDGLQGAEIPKFVLADVQYDPSMEAGALSARTSAVQGRAQGEWLIPMNDQTAFDWAKRIEMGTATEEGFDDYMRTLAEGTYGQNEHIKGRLQAGVTMKTLMNPYTEIASGLLERGADEISYFDPEMSAIIDYSPPGGGPNRMMTLGETAKHVRGLDAFKQTTQGKQASATLVEGLLQKMGVRAGG